MNSIKPVILKNALSAVQHMKQTLTRNSLNSPIMRQRPQSTAQYTEDWVELDKHTTMAEKGPRTKG